MRIGTIYHFVTAVGLLCLLRLPIESITLAQDKMDSAVHRPNSDEMVVLQNDHLGLGFHRKTGTLASIANKLTGETYQVHGDEFEVEAVHFHVGFPETKLVGLALAASSLTADYRGGDLTIQVRYTLRGHFVEKQMTLTSPRDYGLKKLILSRPRFSGTELKFIAHRYPAYGKKPGAEPCCTFFGRSPKGGIFTGAEVPFDASSLNGTQVVLAYSPSLKVKAKEELESAYFGVYRRRSDEKDSRQVNCIIRNRDYDTSSNVTQILSLPMRSESEAMVAMTSTILGPPRFGLVPMACGFWSEMEMDAYTEASVKGDMKSLDFLASCGIDWLSDSHPFGGETEKMNALGPSDKYELGPKVRQFLEHARKVGVKVFMWSQLTNTHPWRSYGKPFRPDKPEWLMTPKVVLFKNFKGNCFANTPFNNWLNQIDNDGLATGYYKAWGFDGDFFGGGGWYDTTIPVDCASDQHDHLPGDSNYACQRALCQLIANVRKHYPDTYISAFRPVMDLGVWALRNVDACFTLVELGTPKDNLIGGDEIRTWSRVRVHREFLPHYIDQSLVFRNFATAKSTGWLKGHLDYILLSALSSSPNQLFYMPTKTGIPDADKAEIRRWLDWGRKNIEYLKVREDLPDWPAAGKIDGSAHIVGDRGLIFLFNSSKTALQGEFALTEEGIGLKATGNIQVAQEYPASDRKVTDASGQTVGWEVPAETAVVLRLQPAP